MKKFFIFMFVASGLVGLLVSEVKAVNPGSSDHALMAPAAAGDLAVYCGVTGPLSRQEPWLLNIAASAGPADDATLQITFKDLDTITFGIPMGTSFSTSQAFGGVPGVDDVVKIELTPLDTGAKALVSARVRKGAKDPFDGYSETDNFCLTAPGDPGSAAAALIIP